MDSIFPLLADPKPQITRVDKPEAIHERLEWLQRVSESDQMDFVQQLEISEPEDSFYPTLLSVLKLDDTHAMEQWKRLEIEACEHKLQANRSRLDKICKHYRIFVKRKPKNLFWVKFAHEIGAEECGIGNITEVMAQNSLPGAEKRWRLDGVTVTEECQEMARRHLNQKRVKK